MKTKSHEKYKRAIRYIHEQVQKGKMSAGKMERMFIKAVKEKVLTNI